MKRLMQLALDVGKKSTFQETSSCLAKNEMSIKCKQTGHFTVVVRQRQVTALAIR